MITHQEQGVFEKLATELAAELSATALLRLQEPLAKHTTFRVGGPADCYVEPASEADLAATLRFCRAHEQPVFILGRGSNVLVRDGGFKGVIICLSRPAFSAVEVVEHRLNCGAGARLKAVANAAKQNGISRLEFLEGIPGSVGGALRMNAGAMGSAIFDVVETVRTMNFEGLIAQRSVSELKPTYRSCEALRQEVALGAVFKGVPAARELIESRMNEFSRKRWKSQPAAASAGCVFKNPETVPAGRLIDDLGLKGTRQGGAMISLEHGNFIINDGHATASEVLQLIEIVRQQARQKRGIELQTEVQIIGVDKPS